MSLYVGHEHRIKWMAGATPVILIDTGIVAGDGLSGIRLRGTDLLKGGIATLK